MTRRSSNAERPVLIVLGAGKPYRGAEPSAIQKSANHGPALEWCIRAFTSLDPEIHFVGGYQIDQVRQRFSQLHYSINPDWATTSATASLLLAPLDIRTDHFVCYSDIVFEADTVDKLQKTKADIVVAIDCAFLNRDRSLRASVGDLETVRVRNGRISGVGQSTSPLDVNAAFVGIAKLSSAAVDKLHALRADPAGAYLRWPFSILIDHLRSGGLSVEAVDIEGRWASFDEPQDVARFVLGTKAETLERLRPLVRKSRILNQCTIDVGAWRDDHEREIAQILETFGERPLIVRSSARAEDSWTQSYAGHFRSVLNVPADLNAIKNAVEKVLESYEENALANQVLVQPMLQDVRSSGVVFTRTLRRGAPYYVVNYDVTTNRTDSVTSGFGKQLRMLVAYRTGATEEQLPLELEGLLPAVQELEELVGHDSLDIEFAIDGAKRVFVLQLRPITMDYRQWQSSDDQVESLLTEAQNRFKAAAIPSQNQAGAPVFGVMPDWNPAEIIGTRPRRLALSLYQQLITNEVWAQQRAECGFRDLRPCPLMIALAGHPYVDVRASFNSFVPERIPKELGDRLATYYVDRLKKNPALHDKVEFEIALTCRTFAFSRRAQLLLKSGFSAADVEQIEGALAVITRQGVEEYRGHLAKAALITSRGRILEQIKDPLHRSWALIEECRTLGTLPFAHLARQGFVAVEMLRSAVEEGIIAPDEFTGFMRSLKTVATTFSNDGAALYKGELSQCAFAERYGHLRPGTYEITLPSYAEDLRSHVGFSDNVRDGYYEKFVWSSTARGSLSRALKSIGLSDDVDAFDQFLRGAIEGREWSKFEFTRLLSRALDCIAEFGRDHGITREQLSHIAWQDIAALRTGLGPSDVGKYLATRANEGADHHRIVCAVELPPLIMSKDDLWCFGQQEHKANFVGSGRVTASILDLSECAYTPHADMRGKIVIIQQADPGYDWLFLRGIAGLITVYGGANSHMAIRAAEFALPAAIGVGDVSYERVRGARSILLDCETRQLSVLH